MSRGRHVASRAAGARRSDSALTPLLGSVLPSRAPRPAAPRPAGRRVAGRPTEPVVAAPAHALVARAGGSHGLAALAPLAALSAAAVVGLAGPVSAPGGGDDAVAGAMPDSRYTAEPVRLDVVSRSGDRAADRTARARPSAAPTTGVTTGPSSASGTTGGDVAGGGASTLAEGQATTVHDDGGPATSAPDEEPAADGTRDATPTSEPSASEPSASPQPRPSSSPTADEEPMTEDEATAQCLEQGISALDVAGLAACVDDLLS